MRKFITTAYIRMLLAGIVLAFVALSTTASASASAGAGRHLPTPTRHNGIHVVSAEGTYEWFVHGVGCPSDDCGQIVISTDGTWHSTSHCDSGSWLAQKATVALSDLLCLADADGETFMGTVGKHGISSVKKPGLWDYPSAATTGTWYAVKL
jgi:hypothetical protein